MKKKTPLSQLKSELEIAARACDFLGQPGIAGIVRRSVDRFVRRQRESVYQGSTASKK